jgi:small-conductance mechanosensitive channel
VPNSELIAGRVLNWTHRNSMGRLVLKFNVCYSADARKAAAILLECARRNPAVMRTPAPKAVLEGLAEKWLEFSLRVYLADINEALDVQSELRISALESLRAAGIDIPGAQPAAAPVAWPGPDAAKRVADAREPMAGVPAGAVRVPELVRDKS